MQRQMDATSSSLQAELQRKKLELAKLQWKVLKAEQTGRRSQRAERTASWSQTRASRQTHRKSPQTAVHATDRGLGSKTPSSADVTQETSKTELPLGSVCGREEVLSRFSSPRVPLSLPHIEVKDSSGLSESLIPTTSSIEDEHPFATEEQNKVGYKQDMKVLSQAGNLVRGSEDPHSPIWLEGVDYPAQYLVRQTRSMSAKMSTQSSDGESAASRRKDSSSKEDSSRDSCNEESLLQRQCGVQGVQGGRRRRKRKGESSSPAPLQSVETTSLQTDGRTQPQQGYDNPRRSCNDLEELRVSIPICRKSPITVASAASQQKPTSSSRQFGTKPPLMKQLLFPQLSQKVSQATTSPTDFFLPDEGFQALKLQKLQSVHQVQSVHQLGWKQKPRRRSKPSKLTSSGFIQSPDTGNSQSDLEACTHELDSPQGSREQLETCSPHSLVRNDRAEQGKHSAPIGGKAPSKATLVSSNLCGVSSDVCRLHCTFMKIAGNEIVTTTELNHVTCLPSVSKPATPVQPLGGSLHAVARDTDCGLHFVAVVYPGRIAVYTVENGGSCTTPEANWAWNSCCLGEDEVVQQSSLLSNSGDFLLIVGGLLKECVARLFVSEGRDRHWCEVNLKRNPPAGNRALHCSALCCWVDGMGRTGIVVGSQQTDGTMALDVWKLQKDENSWRTLQWLSCPLPPPVTLITSLSHVKHTDSWVLGVADPVALLWDANEGVVLKKVALGCSEPQPGPLGVHPIGVAAFHEQGTIFLLLGCTSTGSPPLVGSPPCTCWLLAFEASVTADCNSKVPNRCRLLQSYRPSEEDPHVGLRHHCCPWSATQELFLTAVSGNSVLEWNLLSPQLCGKIHITADREDFSLVSACWLSGRSTFLALDSKGELHVFLEQRSVYTQS